MNNRMQFVIAIVFAIFTSVLGQSTKKAFINALSLGNGNKDLIVEKAVLKDILENKTFINRGPFDSDHPYMYWQITPAEKNILFQNAQTNENIAYSKILSVKRIITQKEDFTVIFIVTTLQEYTAHCDVPLLGYAIYHKMADGQIRITKNYHLLNTGAYGVIDDTLRTVSMGINKIGFSLKEGYQGGGEFNDCQTFLPMVNDSLYKAFGVVTHNYGEISPSKRWSYQSSVRVTKNPTSEWYDFEVITSGTHIIFDKGFLKGLRKNHIERFKETHHYYFDGKKYIEG